MPKSALRDRRALKFYTGKIWGAPARSIPVASCERPELPICDEYRYAQIEHSYTRFELLPGGSSTRHRRARFFWLFKVKMAVFLGKWAAYGGRMGRFEAPTAI